jgi:cyanophycin synthetase
MIIQKEVKWNEYRLLVLMWKVILSINRVPASVTWDWKTNIWDLIKYENENNILRWNWYKKALTYIKIDAELIDYIWKKGINLESVPLVWEKISLRWTSNILTWWTIVDVNDIISDDIKNIACKSAEILWLWIAWIDLITADITKPLKETWWIILEINENPWLWWDRELTSINTGKVILETLFF